MKSIFEWLRAHFKTALAGTGIVGALGGAVVNDFTSWRNANRDFLKVQGEAGAKADQDMIEILRKFANKANGKGSTTDEDLKALKASVTKSYLVASAVSSRMPTVRAEFDTFANALIELQKSAERLTGPGDGKAFVEAVSAYDDSRRKLAGRISSMQTTWPL